MISFQGEFPRIVDTGGGNKAGTLLFVFPPTWSPAVPAGGVYGAPPALAQCFALIAWDDKTLHIQTLDRLKIL